MDRNKLSNAFVLWCNGENTHKRQEEKQHEWGKHLKIFHNQRAERQQWELQIAASAAYGHRTLLPAAAAVEAGRRGRATTESKPTIRARHGQTDGPGQWEPSRPYALDWARTEALRVAWLPSPFPISSPPKPLAWHSMSQTQLFMRFRRFRAIRLPAGSMTMSHEHVALTFRAKKQQLEGDRQTERDRER